MSLLLRFIARLIVYAVLAVIVLKLLTWFTRKNKSDQATPLPSGEWPEDKATHLNRISAKRSYSSSRRDLKDEQERRRA